MEASSGDSSVSSKRIKSQEDRISTLPDSLIQHILSFLPSTREAIRTSILAKRWRNQWTQVPVLIFSDYPDLGFSGENHFRFIENALILHDCPKIKKFHLCYGRREDPLFTSKIRFAFRKQVEELILNCCFYTEDSSYLLPKFLFDSASLVKLELVDCYILPDWRVNWPSLKSLKLATNFGQVIENVLSGSPLLEWLEILGVSWLDQVSIVSESLKVLSLVYFQVTDITIVCPNLVELNIDDTFLPYRMIENVLSRSPFIRSLKLTHCQGHEFEGVAISSESVKELQLDHVLIHGTQVSFPNLEKLDMVCYGEYLLGEVNLPSSVCATLDLIKPSNTPKLLERFQHVDKLTFKESLVRFISDLDVEDREFPLLNSKCLTMNVGTPFGVALPGIVYALSSPRLETLVVKLNSKCHESTSDERFKELIVPILDYWNSNKSTGHSCLESHLRTVKVIGLYEDDDNCKLALEFIEFILENARVLEKMVVLLEDSRKDFVIEVSEKLLSFPRYSQLANVELLSST